MRFDRLFTLFAILTLFCLTPALIAQTPAIVTISGIKPGVYEPLTIIPISTQWDLPAVQAAGLDVRVSLEYKNDQGTWVEEHHHERLYVTALGNDTIFFRILPRQLSDKPRHARLSVSFTYYKPDGNLYTTTSNYLPFRVYLPPY